MNNEANTNFICDNINVNGQGHLTFAGLDTCDLAVNFKTPAYIMDEARIRHNCRIYTDAFRKHFGENARLLYASKANAFKYIYKIMQEEGMGIDVVSCGEILCARAAGYDLSMAYFHSNNKTDEDISLAMELGVGYFVVDGTDELYAIEAEAARRGITQKILLRITPGIDPETYAQVNTGTVDSKSELLKPGQMTLLRAKAITYLAARLPIPIGSQVFAEDVLNTLGIVIRFVRLIRAGYTVDS